MTPRYRVISTNGLAQGSQVIDLETGQPLARVRSIRLEASCAEGRRELWDCTIELVGVAVDVTVLEDQIRRFVAIPDPVAYDAEIAIPAVGEDLPDV